MSFSVHPDFSRPYGTFVSNLYSIPSDESLGYFRASLRDEVERSAMATSHATATA